MIYHVEAVTDDIGALEKAVDEIGANGFAIISVTWQPTRKDDLCNAKQAGYTIVSRED